MICYPFLKNKPQTPKTHLHKKNQPKNKSNPLRPLPRLPHLHPPNPNPPPHPKPPQLCPNDSKSVLNSTPKPNIKHSNNWEQKHYR